VHDDLGVGWVRTHESQMHGTSDGFHVQHVVTDQGTAVVCHLKKEERRKKTEESRKIDNWGEKKKEKDDERTSVF